MPTDLPPLLLRPHYVPKPWGGRRLADDLGRGDLPDGPVGESWEVYDLPTAEGTRIGSLVDGGPHHGRALRDVLGEDVPLLLKVLDAREDLSVQLHPGGDFGKEEAWVALADGARVAVAAPGTTFPHDLPDGAWLERLETVPLPAATADHPAGLQHVPPGTVHAILGGSLLFEVQNPVDVTWRLDDHGRLGLDGRPRATHRREAATWLARATPEPARVADAGRRLAGEQFGIELLPPGEHVAPFAQAVFFLAPGFVRHGETDELVVPAGRTIWLPGPVRSVGSRGWMIAVRARVS